MKLKCFDDVLKLNIYIIFIINRSLSLFYSTGAAWPSIYKAEDHGSKKRPTRPPRRSDHKETFSRRLAVAVLCEEDDTFRAQQVPVSPTCFPWNLSPLERNLKSGDSSVNHNCNQGYDT